MNQTIGADLAMLRKVSPRHQLSKFNIPLLLVHGGKDKRVHIEQAEDLEDELDDLNKTYIWLKFKNEGHGIYKDKNRLEYYQKVSEFLDKYNPAG